MGSGASRSSSRVRRRHTNHHAHKKSGREAKTRRDTAPAEGKRKRRKGSRSNSGRRRAADRHSKKKNEGALVPYVEAAQQPPVDWRGPGGGQMLDPRGAPPTEWRGPAPDWRAPPGQHPYPGPYPSRYGDQPPPRPMPYPPHMPYGQRPPWPGPRPEAGRYPGDPPADWRGPAPMQRAASYGAPGDGARFQEPPPGFPAAFQQAPPGHLSSDGLASDVAKTASATASSSALDGGVSMEAIAGAGNGLDPESDDEKPLPAPTVAERLCGIRIVNSALSDRMLQKLRDAGVQVDGRERARPSSMPEDSEAEATIQAQCAQLGLNGPENPQQQLPMQPLMVPVLPACTAELALGSLWDKFRQRCGTPLPPDPPALPCELAMSLGGGKVVVPTIVTIPALQ